MQPRNASVFTRVSVPPLATDRHARNRAYDAHAGPAAPDSDTRTANVVEERNRIRVAVARNVATRGRGVGRVRDAVLVAWVADAVAVAWVADAVAVAWVADNVRVRGVLIVLYGADQPARVHAAAVVPVAHGITANVGNAERRGAVAGAELPFRPHAVIGRDVARCLGERPQARVRGARQERTVGREVAGGRRVARERLGLRPRRRRARTSATWSNRSGRSCSRRRATDTGSRPSTGRRRFSRSCRRAAVVGRCDELGKAVRLVLLQAQRQVV
jgi:hypothetical protein